MLAELLMQPKNQGSGETLILRFHNLLYCHSPQTPLGVSRSVDPCVRATYDRGGIRYAMGEDAHPPDAHQVPQLSAPDPKVGDSPRLPQSRLRDSAGPWEPARVPGGLGAFGPLPLD